MDLKKFIFNLNYKPNFYWMDKKGEILDLFMQSGLFTEVGGALNSIQADIKSPEETRNIILEIAKLRCLIEKDNIDMEEIRKILKLAQQICEDINLKKETIIRIGVRFFYIGESDFKNVNDFYIGMLSPDLKDTLEGEEFVDSAITPVAKYQDNFVRYNLGPIKRKEYPRYFYRNKEITFDEGYLFDIDWYSEDYHSLRIDKFAENAFDKLTLITNKLEKKILNYAREKKTKR